MVVAASFLRVKSFGLKLLFSIGWRWRYKCEPSDAIYIGVAINIKVFRSLVLGTLKYSIFFTSISLRYEKAALLIFYVSCFSTNTSHGKQIAFSMLAVLPTIY